MTEPSLEKLLNAGDLITPSALAKGLRVSQGAVYAWVDRGLIPHIRLEKCIRFDPAEIREWLERKRKAARKAPGGGAA
jgi:excisionase family DNA binding protein